MDSPPALRRTLAAAIATVAVATFAPVAFGQSTNTSTNSSTNSSVNSSTNTSSNTSNDTSARARRGADFVNGGITQEEADELRRQAGAYPLELQFSRRIDTGDAFVAGVHVRITDTPGNLVMVLPAADPILLANLPPGRYTVEATYEGQAKRQQVTVGRGHQKLGFQW